MLKVSLRGLFAHKYRLILTFVAVIVSVAFMCGTQVLTATIATSFDKVFDDVYKNLDGVVRSTTKVQMGFGTLRAPVSADVVPTITTVPGVTAAEGQVREQVSIIDKNGDPQGNPQAGPPTFAMNWLTRPELNGWVLTEGSRPPATPDEVVIDRASATKAGYQVGEKVKVQSNKGVQEFTLVGTAGFGTTLDYAGASAALFETATAQQLVVEPGKFTWVNVAGSSDVSEAELRGRIAAVLPPDTEAVTAAAFTEESQDIFRQFFEIIGTVLLVFGLVALFVGTFIIYNTFTIIVAQRTRELALLRAMGARRRQVLGAVCSEAAVVGGLSSLLGLGAGALLARGLTALLTAGGGGPAIDGLTYPPSAFVGSFLVGLVITVGSSLVPALRASRIPPVAAMRAVEIDTTGRSRARLWIGAFLGTSGGLGLYWGLFVKGDFALTKTGVGIFCVILGAIVLGPMFARPLSRVIGSPLRTFTGRLARSNAMRNPRRTAATASALMIGVALIVMFSIVIQSLKSSINAGLGKAFTADVIIDSQSFGTVGIDKSLAGDIAAVPGVREVVGMQAGFGTVKGRPAQVLGADLTKLPSVIALTAVDGELGALADNEIAVARQVATEQSLERGSDVKMTVLQGGERTFKVGAIYEVKDIPNLGFLMSDAGYTANFPVQQQTYNQIYVKVTPGTAPTEVRDRLKPVVKARFPTAVVQDLSEFAGAQTTQLDIMLVIISVLLLLAIVIAGLGIINTLLLSVYERTREIGLLRAVGMSRWQVRRVVGWESMIFSLQGTLIGMAIGGVFAWALVKALTQQLEAIKLDVPWGLMVAVPVLALLAGMAAAVLPAFSASRLKVLDAIATD